MIFLEGDTLKLKSPHPGQEWRRYTVTWATPLQVTVRFSSRIDDLEFPSMSQEETHDMFLIDQAVQRYRITLPDGPTSNDCTERVAQEILIVFPDSIVEKMTRDGWVKVKGD